MNTCARRKAGAGFAGFAFAGVDFPGVLEVAEFAAGLAVVAQRAAAGGYGFFQRGFYGGDEAGGSGTGDGAGEAAGGDAGAEEGFGDVDVAEAGDDGLVEQGGFYGVSAVCQRGGEGGGGEGGAQGFRAHVGEEFVLVFGGGGHEVEAAEAAGVHEGDAPVVAGDEDHVFVGGGEGRDARLGVIGCDGHAAGHAEVDQEGVAAGEAGEEVFAAAAEAEDAGAGEAGGEIGGQGPAQVCPVDGGVGDDTILQAGGEASHDSLDFGEFRHGWGVAYTRGMSTEQGSGMGGVADSGEEAGTDFGFRRVGRDEKKPLVRAVFDSVAPKYDVMNDLMSLGIHRVWKRIFAIRLRPSAGKSLLDLASGTGDVAANWRALGGGPVWATDINEAMLSAGRDRAIARGLAADFAYVVADAESLPVPDRSVDVVTIAFGLRNCTDKGAVLAEARRVLKPGGRFFCLEFSKLQIAALAPVYERWSFSVLPRVGKLVAGDAESYRYLAESIRMFPDQDTLVEMMRGAGFARVGFENLSGGIVAIHSGWRL